ncbi:VCBS repeat-containing protein [Halomonas sp. TRM85114]|uniref:SpvB/TcaC N-terminal domain-containing protein n=1 Tax=Halomonas jincaotanensis TaxID=2810616 RepID=UPI001BD4FC36|nr:SpvB/TcaC N-terminal domain-containing protein [Halomonas jincaotanensis]MBS9405430.1 VCBS repeat-containing protein [Halomonas jincaotanensis]
MTDEETAQAQGGEEQKPAVPSISLPKGGGAIGGMGEKFAANPVTGTGSMSVPIATSPGRSGFGPQLALTYDSGAGNGPFGFGWTLSLPSITRKTDKGLPQYRDAEDSDVLILSGAEDLVPVYRQDPDGTWIADHPGFQRDAEGGWVRDPSGRLVVHEDELDGYQVRRYRPRIEGLFARIERWTELDAPGAVHWRSISKDNILTLYGFDANSRIADPLDASHIFRWLICETRDDKGNAVLYRYKAEDGLGVDIDNAHERNRGPRNDARRTANRYLKRIHYGNRTPLLGNTGVRPRFLDKAAIDAQIGNADWMFEVVFDYDDHDANVPQPSETRPWPARSDPFSAYRSGFEVRTYRLCQRVLMFHHFPGTEQDGVGADCLVRSTDFTYSDEVDPTDVRNPVYTFLHKATQSGYRRNNNGYDKRSLPPVEFEYTEPNVQDTVEEADPQSLENLPLGLDRSAYRWTDLHGEGIPGVLTEQGGAWFYKRNLSPINERVENGTPQVEAMFAPVERVATKPNLALGSGAQFMDLAGDGQPDLVMLEGPMPGLYEHDGKEGWQPFRPFSSRLNRDFGDPNLKFVDLDGDGHADVLITENDAFVWHASLAEEGFGPARRVAQALDEEKGPRIVFADGTQSIHLADLSGDGLTDLVRIRNGEVCYWPNLGYGRFGAKVTMDHAPYFDNLDQFDQKRIRLADIDGSGTTDIIYLHRDGVRLYFNQSGNGLSQPHLLKIFPRIDDVVSIVPTDLLGNGTACLVWSSPLPGDGRRQMRYVNLMGRRKPHLLIKTINNLGAETRVDYAPSTKFYLQDKRDGKPWITRLPFPVHVVERVVTYDRISRNRFVTRYAYHHGYFDGEEREFRGFGMVEQFDTEAFEDYVIGVEAVEGAQELAPELNQPPVTSRTWYHTGAFLDQARILHQYRHEYYQQKQQIPEPVIPEEISANELRECARALKGLPLRQEIYSYDGSAEEDYPYTVTENNFEIRWLQPRGSQRHGVFFPVGRESISLNYERNPADPRISHTFGLELDEYGNARKSCSAVYGRKNADTSLPTETSREQQHSYITYAEADYTPDIEQAAPVEAYRLRVPFESRNYEITGIAPDAIFFQFDEIKSKIATTAEIDYEVVADDVTPQKRVLSHNRTLFLDNALNPLPLGEWDSLGMIHQSYTLAFTPGVTAAHYAGKVSDAEFAAAGYVHFDGDINWWMPSGTVIYPADPRAHFYLPIGAKDPMGLETTATFDQYTLLIDKVEVKQAAWSVVTALNDYRMLGPVLMTDPNGNRSAVEHDELGMVVKTAVMGKVGSADGDTLLDPTTRMEYELFNWMNNRKPNYVHTFAREQHGAANPRWQESYAFSNGSGGVAMVKAQAHPGMAFRVNPDGSKVEVDADPRWVGNGRTVLNNKGKPVKQYEPYFSTTHEYEDEKVLREIGVTAILYYDPVGRNIRTVFPNGTFAKVEFTPWWQKVFDANDTVKQSQWYADRGSPEPATQPEPLNDPERRAAWLAAKHADTPGVIHFDSLGRPNYAISDYGGGKTAAVRSESDLTGRFSKLFDQEQREVASGFVSMAGTPIVGESAEKGRRWTFPNALGALVKTWDEHGRQFRAEYDSLHRPVSTFVHEGGQAEILFNYVVYGDRLVNAQQLNLLGTAHQIFDQAGMVRVPELDFKGNPKSVERVLAMDYKNNLDWSALPVQPDLAAIQAAADTALEIAEVFTASSQYDALNRPTQVTLPDETMILPKYNEANFLTSLRAQIRGQGNFIEFLKKQDYDAKGQRQFAQYGNEVFTRYFYDPNTFRLTNLLTYKSGADPQTQGLQNLNYTYDPVGNITQIRDDAQQTHYFNNAVVKQENLYEYDAIYQLVRATGRELAGFGNDTVRTHTDLDFLPQLPHLNNTDAVRNYTEEYEYDLLGNIKVLRHHFNPQPGLGGGWTRHYRHAFDDAPGNRTNRLTATSLPGDPDAGPYTGKYDYDAYGNMIRMPHLASMDWNFMDQLRHADLGGGGNAYYVYGLGGQRMRKVIERDGNLKLEWIFLGAIMIFRRRRRNTNELRFERSTVHISDNTGHIAQVDTKTRDDDNADPANPLGVALIRYQYTNHLGSATLETDEVGNPISYEEYHPYGTTAYRSAKPGFDLSLKRYRFSGKEQDDETGLYYFGARYYVPWLGRWTSSDPAGFASGLNLYRYCSNNPVMSHDPNGMDDVPVRSRQLGRNASWETIQSHVPEGYRIREGINDENYTRHWTRRAGGYWDILERIEEGEGDGSPASTETETPHARESSAPIPPRVAFDPSPPPSPTYPTSPIPKLDITSAPENTDFAREESAARSAYRQRHGITGRQTAVQHPQKWREGARTNTHPRITNDPRFLHPISNVRGTGGVGDNGRPYATEHTLADRGRYPAEAERTQRRYGDVATERATTIWAAQRVRERSTGSRGPLFIREYIVAPIMRGATGHFSMAATRTFVPFVVEAELGLMGAGMALYNAGYASAGAAVFGAASYVPVVGGGLVAGAVVGNAAENLAREVGLSREESQGAGALASVGAGAAVGALIGSVVPGVGTAAGAAVGAAAGLIGYGLSKLF